MTDLTKEKCNWIIRNLSKHPELVHALKIYRYVFNHKFDRLELHDHNWQCYYISTDGVADFWIENINKIKQKYNLDDRT